MIFLMHCHFDLKKSHFDSRNCIPDEVMASIALQAVDHQYVPYCITLARCAGCTLVMSCGCNKCEWNFVCFTRCLLRQFLVEFATTPSTMSRICTMLASCWHYVMCPKSGGIPMLCHGKIPPLGILGTTWWCMTMMKMPLPLPKQGTCLL
jgi:hypothetical protein